jgi:acyl-CoA synthetase (AMP-forming)/AMP-acid ligase II
VYTSGSTAQPKGVMLTHANIMSASTSISGYLGNTSDDVILDVLPLSFDYGLYQVFLAFKAGARLILERSFVYPTLMLDLLAREGVTALPIVPMILVVLLRHDLSAYDCSSLRYVTNTGAALPPAHIASLRERLPHVRIFSMYGLTECKRVSFLAPEEIDLRPTSVGKPMDNVEVLVADDQGRLRETGVGELVIRGSNVMQGYWRAPEETARALKPGPLPGQQLLYSGDRFRIDEDGYLYFEGRLDDMIKSRGQRVSPREVENVLYEIPGVTGAAVVGMEDEVLGSHVKAFVCVDEHTALDERQVLHHCARRLEDFMVPKAIEFVDLLPRTESGKIDRQSLARARGGALQPSPTR